MLSLSSPNLLVKKSGSRIAVRVVVPDAVDPFLAAQWQELENRALEPNPFLSPSFVLPATQHLTPDSETVLLVFETETAWGSELVGLGVFELTGATKLAPFTHVRSYVSAGNTFFSNLLVDRTRAADVLDAFFGFAAEQRGAWACIEMIQRTTETEFGRLFEAAAEKAGFSRQGWTFQRAVFDPQKVSQESVEQALSRNRRKKIRRNRRQLQELGDLSFSVIKDSRDLQTCCENFLRLEHAGWKGEEKSSLRSSPESELFFRRVARSFAARSCMIFTELRLNDRVIASTTNFISGREGFAFKCGWDPEFSEYSPGVLQEVELAAAAGTHLGLLDCFDSGTDMNSWLDTLWPDSRTMATDFFTSCPVARLTVSRMLQLRKLKQKLTRRLQRSRTHGKRSSK